MPSYGGIADVEYLSNGTAVCWVCGLPIWGCEGVAVLRAATVYEWFSAPTIPGSVSRSELEAMAEQSAAGGFVAKAPICLDRDANVVPCDSPGATTQLAIAGSFIPASLAEQYGLDAAQLGETAAASEESTPAPPRQRAKSGPPADKAL